MHTVDEGNEEGDPVSTAWCKFHGFFARVGGGHFQLSHSDRYAFGYLLLLGSQWVFFEEFADALERGVRDILH